MPPSKREDLVQAAMRVFQQNGFNTTNLDRVLEEAGVSRMTLYNHFSSKDELIVAALRRRDETFRNRMLKFVESRATDPRDRLLAVFDYLRAWFTGGDFHGCMFINAASEFCDPDSTIRRCAAEHKRAIVRYLRQQCEAAGLEHAETLAEQLNLLLDGATVTARVVSQVAGDDATTAEAARWAKAAAETLIERASHAA